MEADAFGHRHYAKALRSILESPDNPPPFSVGLLGGWGTGKSSIKELYLANLHQDETKDGGKRIRRQRFHAITFNAWRYGEGDIKRALLRHVYLSLGGDEDRLKRELFSSIQRAFSEPLKLNDLACEFFIKRVAPLLWLAIVIAAVVFFILQGVKLSGIQVDDQSKLITIGLSLLAFLAKDFLGIKFEPLNRKRIVNHVELPRTTSEQYEELLLEQLREYKGGKTLGAQGRYSERLIVFVDDLDRLSADEMVSGLDAIRTFMEIPKAQLPADLGIVFIISCDEEKIAQALARDRHRSSGSELPASVFTRTDARRYLDRIFQFRLEIPRFPKRDMRKFVLSKLEPLDGIAENLRECGVSLEVLVDRMIHVGVQSPRNALQILNAFAQSWWLARTREAEAAGTNRPGGLHEGAVTNHPYTLGAISALRVDFPEFFADLQVDPELIRRLSDVVLRGLPYEEVPQATQETLSKYLNEQRNDVRVEYRPLRQYLASLQTLRWPSSLQPLLILTQDPVTRRYGDRAPRLYESLVSGDAKGVLEELGREYDTRPFQSEDIELLRDMSEDLRSETDARRNNAAAVLASLTDRLPQDQARRLVGPLTRRLAESAELRWRVGIPKIRKVLEFAETADRKALAARLVLNNLDGDKEIPFKLESGESPNIDEAIEIVRQTCDMALEIRKADGALPGKADILLREWLSTRRVKVTSGRSYVFPFSQFESWMGDHEGHLLNELGEHYADELLSQLGSDAPTGFDHSAALPRLERVLNRLWEQGESSRERLWPLLSRMAAQKSQDVAKMSWDIVVARVSAPDASRISDYVAALAGRLDKEMQQDNEGWKLDWRRGAEAILAILEARLADCSTTSLKQTAALVHSWSRVTETGDYAARYLRLLNLQQQEEASFVIDDWIPAILVDLALPCVIELSRSYADRMTTPQQQAAINRLNVVASPENVDEEVSGRYQGFIENLPDSALASEPMAGHFQSISSAIAQRYNNPSHYLERVFVPWPPRLKACAPAPVGSMLHNLFTQAKGSPESFGWLHSQMIEHWPQPDGQTGPYNATQLFDEACDFVRSRPDDPAGEAIARSLADLIERKLVPDDRVSRLGEICCLLWPHCPDEVGPLLERVAPTLQPQQVAGLIGGVDLSSETSIGSLKETWNRLSAIQSRQSYIDTAIQILGQAPAATESNGDLGLSLWFESQAFDRSVAIELIQSPSLNEAQRRRIWLQADAHAPRLGRDFFLDALPKLLPSASSELATTIFESKEALDHLFDSQDSRVVLSEALLNIIPAATSRDVKVHAAKWIRELGGQGVLKKVVDSGVLQKEDLEILQVHFPQDRSVKRALKVLEKDGDTGL